MKANPFVQFAEHRTPLSFGEVVRRFESAVGNIENGGLEALLAASTSQEYADMVRARQGSSGFMRFLTVDHGQGLMHAGVDAECRQYTIGNPVLAWSMVKHDLGAALFVPLQVLIYKDSKAGETVFAYNLPSSLMNILGDHGVDEASKAVDTKLIALGTMATDAAP